MNQTFTSGGVDMCTHSFVSTAKLLKFFQSTVNDFCVHVFVLY